MTSLLTIPGVLSASITDDAGRLIASEGDMLVPTSAVLVLAHATITAASELGRRSGSGDCSELIQHHEGGIILVRGLPRRHALLVRCHPSVDITSLRRVAAQVHLPLAPLPARRTSVSSLDLGDALHAMPAW